MKLRNLMYATMIACAFASCSKDEVVEPGNGPEAGTGDFTISVLTKDTKLTKANVNSSTKELTIKDFVVHVYRVESDGSKTWVGKASTSNNFVSKTAEATEYTKLTVEGLPLNATYVCYGYANLGDKAPKSDNVDYATTAVVEMDETNGFAEDYLPMVGFSESKVFSATGTEYTVDLVRTVSRVDIVGLNLDVDATGATFGADEATFKLTGLSINGVTSSVKSDNGAITPAPGTWGWFASSETTWNNTVGEKDFFHDVFDGVTVTNVKGNEATPIKWNTTVSASDAAPAASYYILPNPSATEVKVALEGLFSYKRGTESTAPLASVYPVVVAKDGMTEADKGSVENNKLYRISITVAGPGSYGRGSMVIAATVSPYELKTQTVVVQ